jgi:hypothetical protein
MLYRVGDTRRLTDNQAARPHILATKKKHMTDKKQFTTIDEYISTFPAI